VNPGTAPSTHRTLTGLTAAWGIGLLAAAAVQGAGALTGGLTFTARQLHRPRTDRPGRSHPDRRLTITWLHRTPAPGPQRNS
jgi:hypothetical protein